LRRKRRLSSEGGSIKSLHIERQNASEIPVFHQVPVLFVRLCRGPCGFAKAKPVINIEIPQLGILGVSTTYKRSRNEYYQTNRCAAHIFTSLPTAQVQIYQILRQTGCYNVVTMAAGPRNIGDASL
jgi:hypothetical protein